MGNSYMLRVSAFAALGCVCGVVHAATDGTFSLTAPGATVDMNYADMQYWQDATIAGEGGYLNFPSTSSIVIPHLIQNSNNLALAGITFNGAYHNSTASNVKIDGNDITLVGDAFLDNTNAGSTAPRIDLTLKGTGDNTLTKRNAGKLGIYKPLKNFDRVILREGAVEAVADSSGNVLVDSSVNKVALGSSTVSVKDATTTHVKFPAALDGDVSGGLLTLGAKATNTFARLDFSDGASLVVLNDGGMANLGTTERLFFDTAPTMTDGILDPRLVTRDTSVTGGPFSFTKYDAEKGVVPFPASSLVNLPDAGEHDVAVVSPASSAAVVNLNEDQHVAALVVSNRANLVIAAGKTLTVGDGVHPAGVIFQEQENVTGKSYDNYSQFGLEKTTTGALDFGTSHGVIWKGTPRFGETGRGLDVRTTIRGSAGVTFASRDMGSSGNYYTMYRLRCAAGWTGPTYVQSARLWLHGSSNLPDGGHVWLIGRRGFGGAEMLSSANLTLSQHFHFAGIGSEAGSLFLNQNQTTFTGSISIEDYVQFNTGDDAADFIKFNCPIRGRGNLKLMGKGSVCFYQPSPEWVGGLTYASSYPLTLGPTGDFGAGPFNVTAKAVCTIADHVPAVFSNDWTVAGTVKLDNSDVTFDGNVTLAKAEIDNVTVSNNYSTIALGGKTSIAALKVAATPDTTTFTASAGRTGVLCVNPSATDDCVFGVGRTDGDGKLSFVKEGAGTATLLPTHGAVTHTGDTRIEAGTLKLGCDPLNSPSLVWHLDATKEDTLTYDAETKKISEWRSCVGTAAFKPYWGADVTYQPSYTNTLNGLKVVTFSEQKKTMYFVSTNELRQRMVFMVCRPAGGKPTTGYYTVFGKNNGDYGFRMNASAQWEGNVSQYKYNTSGYFYCNGVKKTSYAQGPSSGAHVLTMIHDKDWLDSAKAETPSTFTVTVGGYSTANGNLVGDIAEVLAYDRVLSDAEREIVENYLCQRWCNTTPHASIVQNETLLSPNAPLVIGYGATLDLNGHDQTVPSLSGAGTITNSSSVAAVLRVVGANTFTGSVGGNVQLRTAGGDAQLNLTGAASLGITGGTTTLEPYNNLPQTKDLAYWLDAAQGVTTNANGAVTAWASRAASVASQFYASGNAGPTAVVANAINGHPALAFGKNAAGTAYTSLLEDKVTIDRTIFMVGVLPSKSSTANAGLYGMTDSDRGIRISGNNATKLQDIGRVNYYFTQDTMRYNGAVKSFGGLDLGVNKPFCLTLRLNPNQHPDDELSYGSTTKILQKRSRVGCYRSEGANMNLAEVIVYTNTLTDAEMLAVETYLLDKYAIGGHTSSETRTTVFNGTGGLALSGGANVAVAGGATLATLSNDGTGGTLTGDYTINGDFIVDAKNATTLAPLTVNGNLTLTSAARAYCYNYLNLTHNILFPALTVSGTVEGSLDLGTPLQAAWQWTRKGNTWSLGHLPGTFLLLR